MRGLLRRFRLPFPVAAPTPPAARTADATAARLDLDRALLPTDISRSLAVTMIVVFVTVIAAVPAVQIWRELTGRNLPQLASLFASAPTREHLHGYEDGVARNSAAKKAVQPRVQEAVSRLAGFGNSNVVVGCDGWLFYRPGVNLLTGRGLIDPTRLKLRTKRLVAAGETPHPDSRPAIIAFRDACAAAGAHLVVVPIPDKATLQPGQITGRLATSTVPPTNADMARLVADLRAAGIDVFDPTPTALDPAGPPRFLVTDTHWTPEWMGEVARELAVHVADRLPPGSRAFAAHPVAVTRVGDLVDMLGLPPGQTLYPAQSVNVERVTDAVSGASWATDPAAEVVLLGDSFTNIFTVDEMGWSSAAGLGPQLSRRLGRALDVVAINGSGASGTRKEFARRGGPAGKRLVIWQFAARELMHGNWEHVPMPAAPSAAPTSAGPLVVEGTIVMVSKVPAPFSGPYADCLTYTKVRVDRVVEGQYTDAELVAVMWGMKANVRLPAADYLPGRRVKLKLVPLRDAGLDLGAVRRADDIDDYQRRPYLVVEELYR